MPQVIEQLAFTFDELEGSAKERGAQWVCEGLESEHLSESIIDDFSTICDLLGVDLSTRSVPLMNGKTRQEPRIFWSGFWSQGDGASFEGSYRYAKGAAKAIRQHAPQDRELHRIADALEAAQRPYFYKLEASVSTSGHYSHSGTMRVEVEHADDRYRDVTDGEDTITDELRSLADWLYRQLEKEWEYQTSEEAIAETCAANEYRFDEHGRII